MKHPHIRFTATIKEATRATGKNGMPYVRCRLSTGQTIAIWQMNINVLRYRHPLINQFEERFFQDPFDFVMTIACLKIVIYFEQRLVKHQGKMVSKLYVSIDQGMPVQSPAPHALQQGDYDDPSAA